MHFKSELVATGATISAETVRHSKSKLLTWVGEICVSSGTPHKCIVYERGKVHTALNPTIDGKPLFDPSLPGSPTLTTIRRAWTRVYPQAHDKEIGYAIYTDGSFHDHYCKFGFIVLNNGGYVAHRLGFLDTGHPFWATRNFAAELAAGAGALAYCANNNIKDVVIYHDYTHVKPAFTPKDACGNDYIAYCKRLTSGIDCRYYQVKSHFKEVYNLAVDKMIKDIDPKDSGSSVTRVPATEMFTGPDFIPRF